MKGRAEMNIETIILVVSILVIGDEIRKFWGWMRKEREWNRRRGWKR
jgi:hypothetical protein